MKYRIQYHGKKVIPLTITTHVAENTIKAAAKVKDGDMYDKIKDEDLIASEFKYHYHCYVEFTRGFSEKERIENECGEPSEGSSDAVYQKGDFEAVVKFIIDEIIGQERIVSMKELHSIYGLNVDDKRYRYKLKQQIESKFPNEICFLSPKNIKGPDFIASRSSVIENTHCSRDESIKLVAKYLKEDIVSHVETFPELSWPPSIDEITSDRRKPPTSVTNFFRTPLTATRAF